MATDREPLQDEAKARPEWRGDEERPERPDRETDEAVDKAEAAVLNDVAELPPD